MAILLIESKADWCHRWVTRWLHEHGDYRDHPQNMVNIAARLERETLRRLAEREWELTHREPAHLLQPH